MTRYVLCDADGYVYQTSTAEIVGGLPDPVELPADYDAARTGCYRYTDGVIVLDQERVAERERERREDERREAARGQAEVLLVSVMASTAAKTAAPETAILLSPLFPRWVPGVYVEGDPVLDDNDYPWAARQGHDSTNNPDWAPGVAHSLWRPYHGVTRDTALPWLDPTLGAYGKGEWMIWTDGERYRCKRDATVWPPDVLPEAWEMDV